ncbi:thiamine phosphate synthase [Desulfospira joergensenii]|uniref:thiamine phosphate synthase n=1 Tax=Desulfospira joergensenii TaxID=53329 RepID=UPI0003B48F77|nr:thiamine phosphate synthase [Desulfospira joergensenii]
MKGIYLVTDRKACLGRPLELIVEQAARAGAACVQLREKQASTRDFLDRARKLKELLAPFDIPLIINDRLDIALAVDAHGIHLGQSDMDPETARDLLGPRAIIGLSVETWEDVEAARNKDVNYLGVSPVFPTPTKTDTKTPWGLEGLQRIRRRLDLPLVAIGGLDSSNAEQVIRAGADSLAVVSAVCSAEDPFAAAKKLVTIFQNNYRENP